MILSGEHKYENPYDIENTSNRNISLSSGFCDTLYSWTLDSGAVYAISGEGSLNGFIPQTIYTKYKYEDSKNGSNVTELYYRTEDDNFFVWLEYNSATVYSKTVSSNGTYVDGAYITITTNTSEGDNISYIYNFNTNGNISINDNIKLQSETANTNIFSDGTIYTNSIIANDGKYYGSIYSDGEFSGRLINSSGTINNASIKNTNISLTNNNNFIANSYEYKRCPQCMGGVKLFQYWAGGNELVLSTNNKTIVCNYSTFGTLLKTIDEAIYYRCQPIGDPGYGWQDLTRGEERDCGVLICNDLRPVCECTNEELNLQYLNISVEDLIRADLGDYPLCLFHLYATDESCIIPIEDAKRIDDDGGITTPIFNISPHITSEGETNLLNFNGAFWKHTEKESNTLSTVSHNFSFGKISVVGGSTLTIGKMYVKIVGYQPKKENLDKTEPSFRFYWRYVDAAGSNIIDDLFSFEFTKKNEQYNGKQCEWHGTTNSKEFNITKSGDIEIYAKFTAQCTGKQLFDYPYVSCECSNFFIETSSTLNVSNNSTTITKSGLIIKTSNGGELTTIGGDLMLTSSNKKYSIKVTDNGIELWDNGNKTLLSTLINALSKLT
jgi:hypothetical protein